MQSTADMVNAYYKELQATDMPRDVIEDIVRDAASTLVMNHGLDVHPAKATTPTPPPGE